MNITYTFQITILAKFQEEPSANMYDSDDGIKRSTFDLKIHAFWSYKKRSYKNTGEILCFFKK